MAIKVSQKKILKGISTEFEVEFENNTDAEIIYNSILPEIKSEKEVRSQSEIILDNNKIIIKIKSLDIVSLRASINSYVRWINLSDEILKI